MAEETPKGCGKRFGFPLSVECGMFLLDKLHLCPDCQQEENVPYWNGKTSDHPMIQEMIQMDNKKFQVCPNKFEEVSN